MGPTTNKKNRCNNAPRNQPDAIWIQDKSLHNRCNNKSRIVHRKSNPMNTPTTHGHGQSIWQSK